MLYLSEFRFPDYEAEVSARMDEKRTCYNTMYPFFVLSRRALERLDFEPVTILYGGNGSGKSTALNVIAEKLRLERDSLFNRSSFFEKYTALCRAKTARAVPEGSRMITSDDVFDFMLNLRGLNEGIDKKREELYEEYLDAKYSKFKMTSLDDYERLKMVCDARSKTTSRYVRGRLSDNVREQSNGESGFFYFTQKITEDRLYLLDEPENSLSPERQKELVEFLENAVRFFGCQLIIATHSPFLLSMRGAKIYDFDEDPVGVKRWTELKNVRIYYDFFKQYEKEFK